MTTKKKRKYLIDTSAVPVALGESTPSHCNHFADAVADGTCWTSVYIRKEFIHRWVRDYIRMAFTVAHFERVPEALYHLEQALALKPDSVSYRLALAQGYSQAGRYHDAIDLYLWVLELQPENGQAQQALEELGWFGAPDDGQ